MNITLHNTIIVIMTHKYSIKIIFLDCCPLWRRWWWGAKWPSWSHGTHWRWWWRQWIGI